MNILIFAAWVFSQVLFFGFSVWFITFGIRIWNKRKGIALILFGVAFMGIVDVFLNVWRLTH